MRRWVTVLPKTGTVGVPGQQQQQQPATPPPSPPPTINVTCDELTITSSPYISLIALGAGGSGGSATSVPVISYNAYGQITSLSSTAIAGLAASVITSGTFATARLGAGSALSTTFLDGSSNWRTLTASDIPSLDAAKITTGTFAVARLGSGTPSSSTLLDGSGAWRVLTSTDIPNLDAAKITTGTIATARLGSGTANSTTFLRGDQTWATITGGSTPFPTYSSGTAYTAGNIVQGSDGNYYRAIASTTGNDPTTDAYTNWELYEARVNTTLAVVTSGGRFNGASGLLNALSFVANAAVANNAVVTITIGAGTFAMTTNSLRFRSRMSRLDQIRVTGAGSASTILTFTGNTVGVIVQNGDLGFTLSGVELRGPNSGTGIGLWVENGSKIQTGSDIKITQFLTGLSVNRNAYARIASGIVITNLLANVSTVGIQATQNSYIVIGAASTVTGNSGNGTGFYSYGVSAIDGYTNCTVASWGTTASPAVNTTGNNVASIY